MAMEKERQTDVAVATKIKSPKVPRFNVIMYNDDVTTFDFVIQALMDIFDKDQATAQTLAYAVHSQGSAVVGQYSKEVAETKVAEVTEQARAQGYPLVCTVEE